MQDNNDRKQNATPYQGYNIKEQKNSIRAVYMEKRSSLPADVKEGYESKIASKFLNSVSYRHAQTVLCYLSTPNEISTKQIINTALSDGKKVALPRCNVSDCTMNFHYITSIDQVEKTESGLWEPYADLPVFSPDSSLALCIIPAVVFDRSGYRIGYGKGYYDRFLNKFSGSKIGLIYSDFIVDKLPKGRYDCAVDVLITEKGIQALKI